MDVIIPPTIGAALGFMTSEPIPLCHRTGARLSICSAFGKPPECGRFVQSHRCLLFFAADGRLGALCRRRLTDHRPTPALTAVGSGRTLEIHCSNCQAWSG